MSNRNSFAEDWETQIYHMKNLKFLSMAFFAVLACVSFASCSDDDKDEAKPNEYIIGVWELVSTTDDALTFSTIEFRKDNSILIIPRGEEGDDDYYDTYEINGTQLRINLNVEDGIVDDYIDGTYALNGNVVTYKYTWHDGAGKWHHDTEQTMVLKKK